MLGGFELRELFKIWLESLFLPKNLTEKSFESPSLSFLLQNLDHVHDLGTLLLDLRGLTFIDSSALRLFIVLKDRSAGEDWRLSLTRPAGPALSIFQISGAEEHLPFIEDPGAQ